MKMSENFVKSKTNCKKHAIDLLDAQALRNRLLEPATEN